MEFYGISRNFKDYPYDIENPIIYGKNCLPISLPFISHLGHPISCGKFVFPSHYLTIFILEIPYQSFKKKIFPSHYLLFFILNIPSLVINSSSHLITYYFSSWNPISCDKFVFPSHYLLIPILDISFPVVNSSSHLIICHLFSWKSHIMG